MELNYKDLLKAMSAIEDERKISSAVIVDALKEAMAKAYKKDVDLNDLYEMLKVWKEQYYDRKNRLQNNTENL